VQWEGEELPPLEEGSPFSSGFTLVFFKGITSLNKSLVK
jgi:hypothetical protein